MKILYAANNNYHSKVQLERFLKCLDKSKFTLKIAAYKDYLPNCNVDWTLNCLLQNYMSNPYSLWNNNYLNIYLDQIKKYNPDLVISDFEIFTSFIATNLNIKLWHVSSKILNNGLHHLYKQCMHLHKNYSILYPEENLSAKEKDILYSADKNYVYSHWGDLLEAPTLIDGFEWIRPYYITGSYSKPCQHQYVAVNTNNNYNIINELKDKEDAVMFTPYQEIRYGNIINKNIKDIDEYGCNLYNCQVFVSDGTESYLSDAIYNNKKFIIVPDMYNRDSLANYLMYQKIYNYLLEDDIYTPAQLLIKPETKFLHQHLEDL